MRFLHLADTHLGCRRYNLEERTKDFARAWVDIVMRHAIGRQVDFVIIAGDFFNSRAVDAQAMNHAMIGLEKLREAGIPVIAIEGNHDKHDVITDHSWLRSLSKWGYLKLLEPRDLELGDYREWNDEARGGWYIDIKQARIYGSHWYGMSANQALPLLADEIKKTHDATRFNILMLHTDVEGQLGRPIPALSVARLKELRELVDYVALGHTHKRFELDNWAFNPGAPEWCSTDEQREDRGCYLVEVDDENQARVEYITDYRQRPLHRMFFDVSGINEPEQALEKALAQMQREISVHNAESDKLAPIIEINLHGHLGFKNSLLELERLREATMQHANALHVLVKNQTAPVEYAVAVGLDAETSRYERERRIIEDLVTRDNRFNLRAPEIAALIIEAKRLALTDESPDKIVALIESKLKRASLETTNETLTQIVKPSAAISSNDAESINRNLSGNNLSDNKLSNNAASGSLLEIDNDRNDADEDPAAATLKLSHGARQAIERNASVS